MRLFTNKPSSTVTLHTIRSSFFNRKQYQYQNPSFKALRVSSMARNQKPDEEGIAKRLWVKFNKESILSLYTPFVVSLASGNLKLDTFRHYIAQDVHFLKCFAQAYELAEECADDDDSKICIGELRQSVLEELKMHGSFAQEWGFDASKENTPNFATTKYTDFLLATASGKIQGLKVPENLYTPFEKNKIAAYTIAAMAPCMKLYAFLGKKLQFFVYINGKNHPYKKWIDNYSSEDFQKAALQTDNLLDKLSVSLRGNELDIMYKLYHQAMKLEMEFFLAQPLSEHTVAPLSKDQNNRLIIFSDFDLTCTVVDSCAILAQIAFDTAKRSDKIELRNQNENSMMPLTDLKNTWEVLSKQYAEEYEQCMESILGDPKVERFDYEGLMKALERLSDFEKTANMRVIESEVLKGLNLEDIETAGKQLVLQDGCMDFFQSVTKNEHLNATNHILSFCWCADLIRSAFSSVGGIRNVHIHANELTYKGLISTGKIIKKIESPIDKHQVFGHIIRERVQNDKKDVTVYIGDSVGDLLCLVEADVGIVIGSSSSLRRVGSHFGVSFVPLFHGLVKKQRENTDWKGRSGVVYTVSSWDEIYSLVIGH